MDKKYSKLSTNIETDVAVIGGGLAGVWCAYELARAGKKVVLLEKNSIGSGATKDTTAFITEIIDTDISTLVSMYGEEGAHMIWQSGNEAIRRIEETVEREKIDCDFMRVPAYVYASNDDQYEQLKKEVQTAKKLGFDFSLADSDVGFHNCGYAVMRDQAKYSAMKFLKSLAQKAEGYGTQIFEKTEVTEIAEKDGITIKTKNNKTVRCEDVVVATYDPFNHPKQTMLKKGFYISYIIQANIPKDTLEEAIYFDKSNPYFYFRIDKQDKAHDSIMLGGADHKRIIPWTAKKSFETLKKYLESILPGVTYKIMEKWNGPILEPSDGIALIGAYKPHHYVASAFSGNGMTYSAISGQVISDLILGNKNKWPIYDPTRPRAVKRFATKAKDYVDELGGGISQNLKDKF